MMTRGDKLKLWLATTALRLVALLPLRVLYCISNFICFILTHVMHYRDKVVTKNLETSFPDKTPQEIKAIKHEFYRHMADVIVEAIKLLHISDRTLNRHIEVRGADLVEKYGAEGRPIMLMLAHYGNWEWVPFVASKYSSATKSYHVYKPLRSKVSDELFMRIRNRFTSEGIPHDNVVRKLLQTNRENPRFMVGFIADHRTNGPTSQVHVDFLNHSTPVHVAAEPLGAKIGAAYLYLDVEKTSRGHYLMTFKEISPDNTNEPMPITKKYFAMLEQTILRQPPYWLWSHRRWLYK